MILQKSLFSAEKGAVKRAYIIFGDKGGNQLKRRVRAGILAAIMLITAGTYGTNEAFAEEVEKGRWVRTESGISSRMVRGISTYALQGEIHDIFPQSYWGYLDALKAAHPNWKFEAMNTGLDWSYVISQEMYPRTNLVASSYYPWSWLDINSFNYKTNSWVIGSAPDWVQANQQIVEAYMDPRNFLNEENIFQFEKLTFDGDTQTESGVLAIVKGTFMETNRLENGMTYAQAFMKIGKDVNVSPYHLASRVRQEQGAGTSPLISGTVPGYEGYYNYFNIEASGVTMDEIIRNGMEEAKRCGWNTRYAALQGGAAKVASYYITKGQDTLYLQKFDVDPQSNGMFWHQYMQNLSAAESESQSMRRAYINMGLMNSSFTFKIPVYDNMPAVPTQKPTGTGNPNDRLKSITVNGQELIDFNTDDLKTTTYSVNVPCNTKTAAVNARPAADTTTVSYNTNIALSNGKTTNIPIKTRAQNGTERNYTVAVNAANHNFSGWTEVNGEKVRKCSTCGTVESQEINGSGNNNNNNNAVTAVKDIQISNITSEGYRLTVKLTSPTAATEVKFPTWTEKNGQDDLVWYSKTVSADTVVYDIKTGNHNRESGKYYTHVYVYNKGQQIGVYAKEIIVPAPANPATIQTVRFSNVTSDGYTVTVQLKNGSSGKKIQFPTWSEKNGQDDLIWYEGTIQGDTAVFNVKTSNHKGDSGKYYTHVYLTDKDGTVTVYCGDVNVPKKEVLPTISYSAHVQNIGWQKWVESGTIGTTGSGLRLEALKIKINSSIAGNIEYSTHVQNIGWQKWVSNGAMAGTSGKSLRIEAIKIRLSGAIADKYEIQYRAHSQNVGWMKWVSNGAMAGTSGKGLRLEALQIRLVEK